MAVRNRPLTPEQAALKAENTATKQRERTKDAIGDRLRNLRFQREAKAAQEKTISDTTLEVLPAAAEAGWTWDEIADLSGLSRSRVAQVLRGIRQEDADAEARERATVKNAARPAKAAAKKAAAKKAAAKKADAAKPPAPAAKSPTAKKATAGTVAAVSDL